MLLDHGKSRRRPMFRWLRALFAWEIVKCDGVWMYWENSITARRAASRRCEDGWSPLDLDWLDAGQDHPIVNGRPAWRSAEGQVDGRYCY